MTILLSTNNPGKLKEMQELLADLPVQIVTPRQVVNEDVEVEETGQTFQENALLKARTLALKTFALKTKALTTKELKANFIVLADDSGLCVEALNGAPGIRSKRFAPGSDHDRNLHLLSLLEDVTDRRAYFISVLCLYVPEQEKAHYFEGRVDGHIALAEKGTEGFGYDPVFIPEGCTQTFAELGSGVKNTLSHRAKALMKLREFLQQQILAVPITSFPQTANNSLQGQERYKTKPDSLEWKREQEMVQPQ